MTLPGNYAPLYLVNPTRTTYLPRLNPRPSLVTSARTKFKRSTRKVVILTGGLNILREGGEGGKASCINGATLEIDAVASAVVNEYRYRRY
ncbi:hypothetical protein PUN28_001335 [Cardiocondyla obscurior]|uniref:Uncharacterized protein n=1 Tax=Cardiocondyla obscurior TaxID=286306 RepID=A0AAW2H4G4_9HYME